MEICDGVAVVVKLFVAIKAYCCHVNCCHKGVLFKGRKGVIVKRQLLAALERGFWDGYGILQRSSNQPTDRPIGLSLSGEFLAAQVSLLQRGKYNDGEREIKASSTPPCVSLFSLLLNRNLGIANWCKRPLPSKFEPLGLSELLSFLF
jgi:hypothetical protein